MKTYKCKVKTCHDTGFARIYDVHYAGQVAYPGDRVIRDHEDNIIVLSAEAFENLYKKVR